MSEDAPLESKIEAALYGVPEPEAAQEEVVAEGEVVEEQEEPLEEIAEKLEDVESDEGSLAAMLGLSDEEIDVTEAGEVLVKTVIDGEPTEVKVKDLVAAFQGTEFANKKASEIIEQKQQLEQEIAEAQHAAKEKLDQMVTVSSLMEKELLAEFNGQDWKQLSINNPAEYHRLRDMYTEKARRIKGLQESLTKEQVQQQEQLQQAQTEKFQHIMSVETEKIIAANPTWQNPQIREKEMGELRSFLSTKYQYSDEEINQIADSRLVKLIQDAYRSQAPAATVKSKKVVPSFQAPSGGRQKAAANARAVKARKAALRASGSQEALTQVLMDRF